MSLPNEFADKIRTSEDLPPAVVIYDLEAFFNGELTQCPECGGAGYTFIEKRFGAGAENAIPCPNCDQGQVRGPGLEARVKDRAVHTAKVEHEALDWMRALRAELSDAGVTE